MIAVVLSLGVVSLVPSSDVPGPSTTATPEAAAHMSGTDGGPADLSPSMPSSEASGQDDDSRPRANGHIAPLAITCAPYPCYKAGEIYSGPELTALSVETTLTIPEDNRPAQDAYFVGLSIVDNRGRYDQIGTYVSPTSNPRESFRWGVSWTTSESCPETLDEIHTRRVPTDPRLAEHASLARGADYRFVMTLSDPGNLGMITYAAYSSSGGKIWKLMSDIPAEYFVVSDYYLCQIGGQILQMHGLTNYEEVFQIGNSMDVPQWSFHFQGTKADGALLMSWDEYYIGNVPSKVRAVIYGSELFIANQWFALSIASLQFTVAQSGQQITTWGWIGELYGQWDCLWVSCAVSLGALSVPAGWTITFAPQSGVPIFTFEVTITMPSWTAANDYEIPIQASNPSRGQWTTSRILVLVRSFGGGCVAEGTRILTPSGDVLVEDLHIGDEIVEYDPVASSFSSGRVAALNSSIAIEVLEINDGLLNITPRDQPVYRMNETSEGWLQDPQELAIGDLLYNPQTGLWVIVDKLDLTNYTRRVYDLTASYLQGILPATFIGNGIVILSKTIGG